MDRRWVCLRTGDCCRKPEAVTIAPAELDALMAARPEVDVRVAERGDGFLSMQAGPCPFLEGNDCTVYAVRPLNCRRFMCGRDSKDEPFPVEAVPMKVLASRDLRRQYALNQRRAMARWGHSHGWQES
jgi:Fe-S-cluster containining protein